MSTVKSQGLALAGRNYVAQDKIWKDHILSENEAAKRWPENWDFLKAKYDDVVEEEFPKSARKKVELPTPLRPPEVTPLEELVEVHPSTKPVPRTTASEVGWRSSEDKLKLERYGRYAKPKGALVRQLNWPMEAIG